MTPWKTLALFVGILGSGCAEHFPLPLTAADVGDHHGGSALVAYLGQRDASPAVCDTHPVGLDGSEARALVAGLRDGTIAPPLWQACLGLLLAHSDGPATGRLLDPMAGAYEDLLTDWQLEVSQQRQARLEALRQVYLGRPPGTATDRHLLRAVRTELALHHLGPVATREAGALLAAAELEEGRQDGRPVDASRLDQLLAAGDEPSLRRCAARLPDPGLRTEARRRVIRLHIRASSDPEVRAHPAEVEEAVLAQGANPVSLVQHPPLRASLETSKVPPREVLVRQAGGASTLLGRVAGQVSVFPELDLRGALWVVLTGLSTPVTICARPSDLDPTPCLAASEVTLDGPLVGMDGQGDFHFRERLSQSAILSLADQAQPLVLPIAVGGRPLARLDLPLTFERPQDIVLAGSTGAPGPDLTVRLAPARAGRVVYDVDRGNGHLLAVVEGKDLGAFHVVSRGGTGFSGRDGFSGSDGSPGSDGSSASCPGFTGTDGGRGGDGGNGDDGGDGGPGSQGGRIAVELPCQGTACQALLGTARSTIASEGGRGGQGGSGGSGGHGGPGGRGGSGTNCTNSDGTTESLSGGSDGPSGSDGLSGSSGRSGPDGPPGEVTFRIVGASDRPPAP